MMTRGRVATVLAALCVALLLAWSWQKFHSFRFWQTQQGDVVSAAPDEILVMRTPGGLLEVSRIHATEVFETKFIHSVLGVEVGETSPRIRVPVVYRYQVALAPEWNVMRTGTEFSVVAPPVRPALPVAVDLGRMERQASGTWILLPFTETSALDDLQRDITARLAKKAVSPAYLKLQREDARQTVAEFVRKWLVTQQRWSTESGSRVRVYFADEMPDAAGTRG